MWQELILTIVMETLREIQAVLQFQSMMKRFATWTDICPAAWTKARMVTKTGPAPTSCQWIKAIQARGIIIGHRTQISVTLKCSLCSPSSWVLKIFKRPSKGNKKQSVKALSRTLCRPKTQGRSEDCNKMPNSASISTTRLWVCHLGPVSKANEARVANIATLLLWETKRYRRHRVNFLSKTLKKILHLIKSGSRLAVTNAPAQMVPLAAKSTWHGRLVKAERNQFKIPKSMNGKW